jgi:hypothetical protein
MKKSIDLQLFNYARPIFFLLSLSIVGSGVPIVGQIAAFAILLYTHSKNLHEFLIQILIQLGAWNFFKVDDFFYIFKTYDFLIVLMIISFAITSFYGVLGKVKILVVTFLFFLVLIMINTGKPLIPQLNEFRHFLGILFFTIPLVLFKKKEFSLERFFHILTKYSIVIAIMICIQAIASTSIFFWFSEGYKEGQKLNYSTPFFGRVYPIPHFIITLCLYYRNFVKFSKSIILLFTVAFFVSLTNTLWVSIIALLYLKVLIRDFRKFIRLSIFGIFMFFILFYVDYKAPDMDLRIYSSFERMNNAITNKNYEQLGTGRMDQVFVGMAYIEKNDLEFKGMGLYNANTAPTKLFSNERYDSYTENERFIGHIEITDVSLWVKLGYLAVLLVYFFHFVMINFFKKISIHYLWLSEITLFCILMGVGGFFGLVAFETNMIIGLIIGILILEAKDKNFKNT